MKLTDKRISQIIEAFAFSYKPMTPDLLHDLAQVSENYDEEQLTKLYEIHKEEGDSEFPPAGFRA